VVFSHFDEGTETGVSANRLHVEINMAGISSAQNSGAEGVSQSNDTETSSNGNVTAQDETAGELAKRDERNPGAWKWMFRRRK